MGGVERGEIVKVKICKVYVRETLRFTFEVNTKTA